MPMITGVGVCSSHGIYRILDGSNVCPSCVMGLPGISGTPTVVGTVTTTLDMEAWLAQVQALKDERDLWKGRALEVCRAHPGMRSQPIELEWAELRKHIIVVNDSIKEVLDLVSLHVQHHNNAVRQGVGNPNPDVVRLHKALEALYPYALDLKPE